jgi:hypothetical protein
LNEGEFQKRSLNFNDITNQECNYSCRLDHKKFPKPDRTQIFVKIIDIEEAKKEFEQLIFGTWSVDEEGFHDNVYAKDSYISPSEAIKWFRKWFGNTHP